MLIAGLNTRNVDLFPLIGILSALNTVFTDSGYKVTDDLLRWSVARTPGDCGYAPPIRRMLQIESASLISLSRRGFKIRPSVKGIQYVRARKIKLVLY
jgi:hypothetical protein